MNDKQKSPRTKGLEHERELISARRKIANVDVTQQSFGVALSGGGIRSATFNFGLLRALAKNEVLKKIDYLSTVSGGGYIGAALGRLYQGTQKAQAVEDGLKAEDTLLLWWMRSNGRYLIPAGVHDLGLAFASILRGFIATQLEIGMLMLLISCVIVAPYLFNQHFPLLESSVLFYPAFWTQLATVWWWVLGPVMCCGLIQIFSYWLCRVEFSKKDIAWQCVFWLVLTAVSAYFTKMQWIKLVDTHAQSFLSLNFQLFVLAVCSSAFVGSVLQYVRPAEQDLEAMRLRLTIGLSTALWCCLAIICIAVVDMLAFKMATALFNKEPRWVASSTAVLTISATVIRAVMPNLQQYLHSKAYNSSNLQALANYLGLALILLLLITWTTLLYVLILKFEKEALSPTLIWAWVFFAVVFFLAITRRNFDQINLASMHHFYRSRLERVYVGVGNFFSKEKHNSRFPETPLHTASRAGIAGVKSLLQAMPGDDILLADYQPHKAGGPVHLINCCINQSVDDRTGNFNADRKGVALTVSSLGIETGTNFPLVADFDATLDAESNVKIKVGSLSRWVSVSGAAVGSGMGSHTLPGLASLVFISGMRLGFWCKALLRRDTGKLTTMEKFLHYFPKSTATVAELFGRFPGLASDKWYLSDGGHFDNTGVYALLKRRLDLIVLADCGADPSYRFDDVENLVRKAEIDYSTKIEFINPALLHAGANSDFIQLLGTPETIDPDPKPACLMVGRITYPAQGVGVNYEPEKTATLIVIKPRRLDQLPFDIVGYADRNLDFPQQSTSNQFFSEEQWESYYHLGLHIGKFLTAENLQTASECVDLSSITTMQTIRSELIQAQENESSSRRSRLASAVGATVGAGVSLSLILATWQGFEQYRSSAKAELEQATTQIVAAEKEMEGGKLSNISYVSLQQIHAYVSKNGAEGELQNRIGQLINEVNKLCDLKDDSGDEFAADLRKQKCSLLAKMVTQDFSTDDQFTQKSAYWKVAQTETANPPAVESELASPSTASQAEAIIVGNIATSGATICDSSTAKPARLYVQIYDEASRKKAESIGKAAANKLSLNFQGVENVVTTAEKNGKTPPFTWYRPALLFHAGVASACKDALYQQFQQSQGSADTHFIQRDLLDGNAGDNNVIEFWLPPTVHK